jgi:hypothetical protein
MNEQETAEQSNGQQTEIKSIIKGLFQKVQRKTQLEEELEEINKELAEYGLASGSEPSRLKGARSARPELNMESLKEFIKSKGKDGANVSDMKNHFGQKFDQKKKDFQAHFKIEQRGTAKYWMLKK